MRSELKYPIAVDKITQELRYAGEVKSGRDCDCYCKLCERNMIAINGGIKQRSHFRHEANSNCSASYESYIHWLTKEVFREISTLSLPDLSFLNLDIDFRRKLFQLFDQHNLPTFFRNQIKDYLITDINAKTKCFKIESVDIEKEIKTSNGKIRVDIVVNFGNSKLFIEPYFKNPISHEKLKLIEEIGISTVSISLSEFVIRNNLTFSKEELIDFLSNNLQAKSWAYHKINPTSFAKNLDFVKKIIKDKASTLNIYATKEKEIVTIDSEIIELTREQEKIFAIITEKRQHKEAIKKYLEDFDLGEIN
jgi:hypothetical protein